MAIAASEITDTQAWRTERKRAQFQAAQTKLLATARRHMDRLGLSGMDENAAQERIAALHELTSEAFKKLLFMEPGEARESAIQAVARAHLGNGKVVYMGGKAYEPDERQCKLSGCGVWFKVTANKAHQMYCSEAHRKQGERYGRY